MKLDVIIIDDCPVQLMFAEKLVREHERLNLVGGYTDPLLGLSAVNNVDVDLVLLDVEMPGINGFELKKLFKSEQSLKVIINSSKPTFEKQSFESGAIDFLNKPLSEPKFSVSVKKAFSMEFKNNNSNIEMKNVAS